MRAWCTDEAEFGTKSLRITRRPKLRVLHENSTPASLQDEVEEDDDEVLLIRGREDVAVLYDIVHSPSYQVPVLYITMLGSSQGAQQSPSEIIELLVPSVYKEQVREVGVLGALSMTEHPITGLPAYFVHPCRTQDAMASLSGKSEYCPAISYLTRWIGVIGSSVDLGVPVALIEVLARSQDVETHRELERS